MFICAGVYINIKMSFFKKNYKVLNIFSLERFLELPTTNQHIQKDSIMGDVMETAEGAWGFDIYKGYKNIQKGRI